MTWTINRYTVAALARQMPIAMEGESMTTHVAAVLDVFDAETFGRYVEQGGAAVAKHGGRVAEVAMPDAETLEDSGAASSAIIVLLEFPSPDAARAWISDPELQSIHALRRGGAKTTIRLLAPRG